MIELIHDDCMTVMAKYPDNHFDLAIVDPPYGIGWDKDNLEDYNSKPCKDWQKRKPKGYDKKSWDSVRPNQEYFKELQRVSKNQIIWGGNYFSDYLKPTGAWIVWDKQVVMPTFSDGELAWCSIKNSVKFARFLWAGYRKCEETNRIHPTQKPTKLYQWLLSNYAEKGQNILDTHLGSGSSAIAAHYFGCDFVGMEIDKDYYDAACERFKAETAQEALF